MKNEFEKNIEKELSNCPGKEIWIKIIYYLQTLKYDSEPDYSMIYNLLTDELNRLNIDINSDLHYEEEMEDIYKLDSSIEIGSFEHYLSWIERVDKVIYKRDKIEDVKIYQQLYDELYEGDVNAFIGIDFEEKESVDNSDIDSEKNKHIYFFEIANRINMLSEIIEKNSVQVRSVNKGIDLGIYSSKKNTPRKTPN